MTDEVVLTPRERMYRDSGGNDQLWNQIIALGFGTPETIFDHHITHPAVDATRYPTTYESSGLYHLISHTTVLGVPEGRAFIALAAALTGHLDPWIYSDLDESQGYFRINDLPTRTKMWTQALKPGNGDFSYVIALMEDPNTGGARASIRTVRWIPGTLTPQEFTLYYELPRDKRSWCLTNSLDGPIEGRPEARVIEVCPLTVLRLEDLGQMTVGEIDMLMMRLQAQHADGRILLTRDDQGVPKMKARIVPALLKETVYVLLHPLARANGHRKI